MQTNLQQQRADQWLHGVGQGRRKRLPRDTWKLLRVVDVFTILIVVSPHDCIPMSKLIKLYTLHTTYCMSVIPH